MSQCDYYNHTKHLIGALDKILAGEVTGMAISENSNDACVVGVALDYARRRAAEKNHQYMDDFDGPIDWNGGEFYK